MTRLTDFATRKFDLLVVGGGTAGLALAARLSERPDITVGVIEAGPAVWNDPAINVPGRYGETLGGQYDWKFETTAQPGLAGRRLPWPRGKVLGGTSALNFMAWNRGNREDYDTWEELGNKGWGWEDLHETFHPPDLAHQTQYRSFYTSDVHGSSGPIQASHVQTYGPSHAFWHETLNRLGVDTSADSSAGSNIGCWNMVCALDPGSQSRSYSANAYYLPASRRPNLAVLTEATVAEIILERDELDAWIATGVRVRCDGQEMVIPAGTEIILAAGSVQSPQLLELSGIGNREILDAAGIAVKVHNPNVGENLQEHIMTATIFEVASSLASRDDIKNDPKLREAADHEYDSSRSGPWTILPCSIAYCPLSQLMTPDELSAIHSRAEAMARSSGRRRDQILARQFQNANLGQVEYLFDLGNWSPYFPSQPGKKYGTMLQMLQYPLSRGSIHIPAKDPGSPAATVDDKPIIDPRYYIGPGEVDFDIMKIAQKFGERICTTRPLADIIQSRVFPPLSYPKDEYNEFVRNYTITDWHPVGTCAMGGFEEEKGGVVDERLRVYGARGLRVVDASIMPVQISAHIQATVYAIAEKAASMILEDIQRADCENS